LRAQEQARAGITAASSAANARSAKAARRMVGPNVYISAAWQAWRMAALR
jgi:hypothetical protein